MSIAKMSTFWIATLMVNRRLATWNYLVVIGLEVMMHFSPGVGISIEPGTRLLFTVDQCNDFIELEPWPQRWEQYLHARDGAYFFRTISL